MSPSKTGKQEEAKRAPSPDKKKKEAAPPAKDDKKKAKEPAGKKDAAEAAQVSTLSERTDAKTIPDDAKSEQEI